MELRFNTKSPFTKWIVREGLLREPFVVVDVGVLGGENPRWHLFGDYLVVHGFDAIEEVVAQLRDENAGNPKRTYHAIAGGNVDEERTFYFNAAVPTSSSFVSQGTDRYRDDESKTEQARTVSVRRLDSLLRDGVIPPPDFLKVDVEGFEKDVLLGSSMLLRSVLCAEIETNFNMSPSYPAGHFNEIYQLLLPAHLRVLDINFNRVPRKHFRDALDRKDSARLVDWEQVGAVATFNTLFCRDLIDEADHQEFYPTACEPVSLDQLIKTMAICELYGLSDVAFDTAVRFKESLAGRLDVDKVFDLLAERPAGVIYPIKPDRTLKRDHEAYLGHIRDLERLVAADRSGEVAKLAGTLKAEHQAFVSRIHDLRGVVAGERGSYSGKIGELTAKLRAEHEAFVARIWEIERELAMQRGVHAGQTAELTGKLKAEHEAFVTRIRELERELAVQGGVHAAQIGELTAKLRAEHEAFVARIRELERELALRHGVHADQIADLQAVMTAERRASVVRVTDLERVLEAERAASIARIRELERTLDAERSVIGPRILGALVAASERRGAIALVLRLGLGVLRKGRRVVKRVLGRPPARAADGAPSERGPAAGAASAAAAPPPGEAPPSHSPGGAGPKL